MRSSRIVVVALLACACEPSLGECDEVAALEVVYDADGIPAYAGQALMITSCGSGSFCHAEGIEPSSRFGAPAGLDYDLRIAATTADLGDEERLARSHARTLSTRGGIWSQVESGQMPPGEVGRTVLESGIPYDRRAADGTFSPMPSIESDEGRTILRNWLACNAPVVERTVERFDRAPLEIGRIEPMVQRRCTDPTWPSIYATILRPSCGTEFCHAAGMGESNLSLAAQAPEDFAAVAAVLGEIVGRDAEGTSCLADGGALLVPGDAEASLLWRKVSRPSAEVCGLAMPLGGTPLTEQQRCALEAWIECGACADPRDAECQACAEEARGRCEVNDECVARGPQP